MLPKMQTLLLEGELAKFYLNANLYGVFTDHLCHASVGDAASKPLSGNTHVLAA